MSAPKEPFWLKPQDVVLPSLSLVAAAACFFLAFKVRHIPDVPPGTQCMLGVVAVVLSTLPTFFLHRRWKAWQSWSFVKYENVSLMLDLGDYREGRATVVLEVLDAFKSWWSVYGKSTVDAVAEEGVIWVRFEKMPIKLRTREVSGHTDFRARTIVVGYNVMTQNVHTTALQHEVGHIVMHGVLGTTGEEEHHTVARDNGLR